ncbi:nitrate reductase [Phycisphaera mikurensis NBRC 102666]|uniref:Nitrate reductase n=1 Tax=Phycisphaera mikurensis (strain NBRC 102666 / KCTC 22515 / FYK2301M01) TaxID=1142394 RepID=I0IG06_PHYMF|nr:nitrate reductase [Phycisphaera mikurensis NBRC 102666]
MSVARAGKAVCPYCGVGCVLTSTVEGNAVKRIRADPADAPNFGMMCPKGALAGEVFSDPDRLTRPLIRREKGGPLEPATWEQAIVRVADALAEAPADRVAWYGSGQLDTEASYAFTKLFKGLLGCNHTDTNSRLCMSSAVAGYTQAFGSDGPPGCYADIEEADTFLILGANMAANHPVLFNRVRRRRVVEPDARIVVVDPRRTRTAAHADHHLAVAPGGDVPLLRFLARALVDAGEIDAAAFAAATDGGAAWLDRLAAEDPDDLARRSGVPRAQLDAAAETLFGGRKLMSLYCMGANQSAQGTLKNRELIHLSLLLGQLGRPGCGPFSLTGQPNAMGGREVGYLAHQLPGYRLVAESADREAMERFWGTVRGSISPEPGRAAVEMFKAAAAGATDVLWVACTNPVASLPDAERTREALRRTPLVVVQDVTAASETVAYADVVLPACQWGEKAGTMTNSERLVVRSDRFLEAPGACRPDWWIVASVGHAIEERRGDAAGRFAWASHEDVWDEFRRTTTGRPCDLAGMTNERLRAGPLQWPCPDPGHPGTARRYAGGRVLTASSKPRTAGETQETAARSAAICDAADAAFPLVLTTGRVASQWHSRTKTRHVAVLDAQEGGPFFEVHPDDAAAAGVTHGDRAAVVGRRGRAEATVRVSDEARPGCVFSPFHWADSAGPLANVNQLTSDAVDPASQQPELKACAVRIEKVEEAR